MLKDGSLIETGNHEELLRDFPTGTYANFLNKQQQQEKEAEVEDDEAENSEEELELEQNLAKL